MRSRDLAAFLLGAAAAFSYFEIRAAREVSIARAALVRYETRIDSCLVGWERATAGLIDARVWGEMREP